MASHDRPQHIEGSTVPNNHQATITYQWYPILIIHHISPYLWWLKHVETILETLFHYSTNHGFPPVTSLFRHHMPTVSFKSNQPRALWLDLSSCLSGKASRALRDDTEVLTAKDSAWIPRNRLGFKRVIHAELRITEGHWIELYEANKHFF